MQPEGRGRRGSPGLCDGHHTGDLAALEAAGLDAGFDSGGEVSGRIRLADVEALAAVPGVERITMEPRVRLLDGTVAEMRVPWKVPPTAPWPGRGANVIVAVIDTGIDIFHDSFRKADNTTRILEIWDQDITAAGGANPPAGFQQIGKVYNAAAINAALAGSPPFNTIDNNGHGTHVAGIAAGNGRQDDRCSFPGRYVGVAPEADLVICRAIALPNGQSGAIRDALNWCAQAGTRNVDATHPVPRPVVINCSFGSDIGPHDGTAFLDRLVDQLLRPAGGPPPGLAVVVAAGNEGAGTTHENGIVAANGSATVAFTMPPGSSVADILDIWYNGTATLSVTLTAPPNPAVPGPNTVGPIAPGAGRLALPARADDDRRHRVDERRQEEHPDQLQHPAEDLGAAGTVAAHADRDRRDRGGVGRLDRDLAHRPVPDLRPGRERPGPAADRHRRLARHVAQRHHRRQLQGRRRHAFRQFLARAGCASRPERRSASSSRRSPRPAPRSPRRGAATTRTATPRAATSGSSTSRARAWPRRTWRASSR